MTNTANTANANTAVFRQLDLGNTRLGHASVYAITVTILTEMEGFEKNKDKNIFSKMMLEMLSNEFKELKNLCELIEQNLDKDYTKLYSKGPYRFENVGANPITLDQVKLGTLVRTLVTLLDRSTQKLFRRDDPNEWDPYSVTFNRLASADLSQFATEMLKMWQKIDDNFANKFSETIKQAADASRGEQKSKPKYNPKPTKTVESKPKTKFIKQTRENELKPPLENAWTKRKQLQEKEKATDTAEKPTTVEETNDVVDTENADNADNDDNPDDNETWQTVHRKQYVNLEVDIGGKKMMVRAKVCPDGKYKQVKSTN